MDDLDDLEEDFLEASEVVAGVELVVLVLMVEMDDLDCEGQEVLEITEHEADDLVTKVMVEMDDRVSSLSKYQ